MSVLPVGFGSSGVLEITNSVRLRASASAYLSRTFGAPTTQDTFTFSAWVKRGTLGVLQNLFGVSTNSSIGFPAADTLVCTFAGTARITTTALYRDPSAWMHIVYKQTTGAGELYVNGVSVGTTATVSAVFNTAVAHQIGAANTSNYHDGYLSDVYFIDGQALTPSSFGETNSDGVWVPKGYTGTYGTNGFHLDFKDAALTAGSNVGLGKDVSGNGNYWTTNNISVTSGVTYDSMVDTPTNNYATLNPLRQNGSAVFGSANLKGTSESGTKRGLCSSMVLDRSVVWYAEVTPASSTTNWFGVTPNKILAADLNTAGQFSVLYYAFNGNKYVDGSTSAYGTSYTTDVIGIKFDGPGNTVTFYKGTTAYAAITLPSSTEDYVFCQGNAGGGGVTADWTFGQMPFVNRATNAPTAKALCTANLPAVAITKPASHFDAKTRTGTGAAFNVTGEAFQPDLVWSKGRSGATDHAIYDAVRGVEKRLESNNTDAEVTGDTTGLTAFNSDGYSGGALAQLNTNAATYIDWMWKAGGAGASNTDGSITSTVSANQTAGFSIVTWTGNGTNTGTVSVGHGLGVTPAMVIIKERSNTNLDHSWVVLHKSLTAGHNILLNSTNASFNENGGTNGGFQTATNATYTVFKYYNGASTANNYNTLNATMVAYCFAEIPGYSKFGSVVCNATTDNAFVYTGISGGLLMVKCSSTTGNWVMIDVARQLYNVQGPVLLSNSAGAESSQTYLDCTANGFKIRSSGADIGAAQTYIYAHIGGFPFGGSNCAPSPAR